MLKQEEKQEMLKEALNGMNEEVDKVKKALKTYQVDPVANADYIIVLNGASQMTELLIKYLIDGAKLDGVELKGEDNG